MDQGVWKNPWKKIWKKISFEWNRLPSLRIWKSDVFIIFKKTPKYLENWSRFELASYEEWSLLWIAAVHTKDYSRLVDAPNMLFWQSEYNWNWVQVIRSMCKTSIIRMPKRLCITQSSIFNCIYLCSPFRRHPDTPESWAANDCPRCSSRYSTPDSCIRHDRDCT